MRGTLWVSFWIFLVFFEYCDFNINILKIHSKIKVATLQRRQWSCFLFIIINIEQGETSVLSLLMDLNIFFTCSDNSVPSDSIYSAGIYLFKVNNRNSRTRCEICSKLNMFKYVRHHWRRSGVFIVNFEHISHLLQVFLSLTSNM